MIDLRPILFICGLLLSALAAAMLVPAAIDLSFGNLDWVAFCASAGVTLFAGVALVLTNRVSWMGLGLRQAFVLTSCSWLAIVIFAALPFTFSALDLSYTDAFFEAMSGITTTGSTVIVGLDAAPPGILFWRALLQWLGGIGIIVTAIAILPMLQVGGMQLFRTESTDQAEKALPRLAVIGVWIAGIYVVLTALWTVLMWLAGLTLFDATAHAMTTIATGGFSTVDASIGHFRNPLLDWIVTAGMVAGALPFGLYLQALRGRPEMLLRDTQVRAFLGILGGAVVVILTAHALMNAIDPLFELRYVVFNAVSVMTGTGYATADYSAWGPFANAAFFVLMFIGGCAGSTACGIKVFRFQVMYATAAAQLARLVHPHSVVLPTYGGRALGEPVIESVVIFFFVYVVCFFLLAMALGLFGLDFLTATSGAATAISNVGPGLGEIVGPAGSFASIPDGAKWVMCAGMLLGRLELFTVLVLFAPSFWRV